MNETTTKHNDNSTVSSRRAFRVHANGAVELCVMNKHGVTGWDSSIGSMWVSSNGSRTQFIPDICYSCQNHDYGESGEYGGKLSPDYCMANVWWPTKKGTCGKYDGYRYKWNAVLSVWLDMGVSSKVDNA